MRLDLDAAGGLMMGEFPHRDEGPLTLTALEQLQDDLAIAVTWIDRAMDAVATEQDLAVAERLRGWLKDGADRLPPSRCVIHAYDKAPGESCPMCAARQP